MPNSSKHTRNSIIIHSDFAALMLLNLAGHDFVLKFEYFWPCYISVASNFVIEDISDDANIFFCIRRFLSCDS